MVLVRTNSALQVFKEMLGLAQQLLSSLSHEAGGTLPCTKQQLLDLISPDGQQHASILHINCYHAAAGSSVAAAACSSAAVVPVAGGCEAHVDRGLLTLIADTAGGLQVRHQSQQRCYSSVTLVLQL
jgi:isopenicillin N synthase-like dioxygenase